MATDKKKKRKKKRNRRTPWYKVLGRLIVSLWKWGFGAMTDNSRKDVNFNFRLLGRKVGYAGFVLLMLIGIVVIYALLSSSGVTVNHEDIVIAGLPDDLEGYKILLISDLNGRSFGQEHATLMRQLSSESYNCVVFTGDMVGSSGDAEPFYTLIEQLGSKKMFFIAGDCDPGPLRETPNTGEDGELTVNEVVMEDWVLGAIELGCTYVDVPVSLTKGSATIWFCPDTFLNMNVTDAYNSFKEEYSQEGESYLEGVEKSKLTLPFTTYRKNLLSRAANLVSSVTSDDVVIMLSHEVPTDAQLTDALKRSELSGEDAKYYFIAPNVVLSGHYCGGEWKLPIIGTLHVNSSILPRYGWFPDESYVSGQRTVGSISVYTTAGLGNNGKTLFFGRLLNPPQVDILTLTGELPEYFYE